MSYVKVAVEYIHLKALCDVCDSGSIEYAESCLPVNDDLSVHRRLCSQTLISSLSGHKRNNHSKNTPINMLVCLARLSSPCIEAVHHKNYCFSRLYMLNVRLSNKHVTVVATMREI